MTLYYMPTVCTLGHVATEYYEMDYRVIYYYEVYIYYEIQMLYRSTVAGN